MLHLPNRDTVTDTLINDDILHCMYVCVCMNVYGILQAKRVHA